MAGRLKAGLSAHRYTLMAPRPPDPDVVGAARIGAGWAFERLYESLSPAVLGYLQSQGCADPEGAVGEVFLRVFRRLGDFEGSDAQLRSWVFTIAHNLLIDERRMRSGRRADLSLEEVATAMDRSVGAVKALQHRALASLRRRLEEILPEAVSPQLS